MVGQKRKDLLTDKERDRLINRDDEDAKVRCNNDLKARNKLSAWLQNISDVQLILDHLPEDQTEAIVNDEDIYKLFHLTDKLLSIKKFSVVVGRIEEENWSGYKGEADDLDVYRAFNVHKHIDVLEREHLGLINPFTYYDIRSAMAADKELADRLEPGEKRGLERIERAIRACGGEGYRNYPWSNTNLFKNLMKKKLQKEKMLHESDGLRERILEEVEEMK